MTKKTTSTLAEGDIVQLKTGGPEMVVEKAFSESARCVWFAGKKREQGSFPIAGLVLVPPKDEA